MNEVVTDIKTVRQQLDDISMSAIKRASEKRPALAMAYICFDWLVIFGAYGLTLGVSILFLPLTIFFIGWAQRGIGNLLHEASHRNLFLESLIGNIVINLFLAIPSFTTLNTYRKSHNQHHQNLGSAESDPDFIDTGKRGGLLAAWSLLFSNIFHGQQFIGSLVGGLRGFLQINFRGQSSIVLVWLVVLFLLVFFMGSIAAITTIDIWFTSRATVFHVITIFREMADHVGLAPGGVFSFTRNNPKTGMLRHIFHPHNNGYHLVHHLFPGVPFYSLPSVDKILARSPFYKENEIFNSTYFQGSKSVMRSFVGWDEPAYRKT